MKVFLAAILLIGICVIGMCFNIIFRKNGHFPKTEVHENENMRKLGIKCMKEQEDELFGEKKNNNKICTDANDSCTECGFYTQKN